MMHQAQNVSGKISDAGFKRLEAESCDRRDESFRRLNVTAIQGVTVIGRAQDQRALNQSVNFRVDGADLRHRIIRSLRAQGFRVRKGTILPPKELSKESIRELHETAVAHRIEMAKDGLFRKETLLCQ